MGIRHQRATSKEPCDLELSEQSTVEELDGLEVVNA